MRRTSLTIAAIAGAVAGFVPPSARVPIPPATTSSFLRPLAAGARRRPSGLGTAPTTSSAETGAPPLDRDRPSSPPDDWRSQVLSALSAVIDPDLNSDIVTLGFVQNLRVDPSTSVVSLDLELTTPACPVKDLFVQQCRDVIEGLGWTPPGAARISLTSRPADAPGPGTPSGMARVGAVVAVSSCKGGVGKSTTAVNLAFALHGMGAKVGIFDADVYGPSLPTMVVPDDDNVRFVGRQIAPLTRGGVSLMSFGYVNEGSAVMRGPMVTQLLDQFLSLTQWGDLDYLILDMPPGTGDIQLTLTQKLNITAAVIVTTPQELSFVDVERGVQMFDTVNVPCVAVVENMAYLERARERRDVLEIDESSLRAQFAEALRTKGLAVDAKGAVDVADDLVKVVRANMRSDNAEGSSGEMEQIRIFGPGHKRRLSEQWGIEHSYSIPLLGKIAQNGDSGTPFILDNPTSPQAEIYRQLAKSVVSEVAKAKYGKGKDGGRPNVMYVSEKHSIQVVKEGHESTISPAELRRGCRCAACVEELTGKQILNPKSIPESVRPLSMSPTGNYALSVDWSDGHRSLYPYRQIVSMIHVRDEINLSDGGSNNQVD
ncbi:hypothetical protein ACHAW5_002411 [Stephanodiscus triporus]|uniref:MIP18 family-like domain-containing protein n=1 Tax=Stephanodiscus triporus TaxID=2934178 RepID=A0ABD3NYY5_9STRA